MSRLRNAVRSVASGYTSIAVTGLYTLASVPLALHYLSKAEFGLWTLVTQIAGYILLIDLGITGSVARILMDHKDERDAPQYGSVVQTGGIVLLVQGVCIALGGCLASYWLPALLAVPEPFAPIFRFLVAGQCVLLGAVFGGRVLVGILTAHQRFDMINYVGIIQLVVTFGVQWLTFHRGWGLYSLLAASFAGLFCGLAGNLVSVLYLGLFPTVHHWGRPTMKIFKEMFAFANDLFLVSVGGQLLNASQVLIISRVEGTSAAAVWAIATKAFQVAAQFVQRLFDFSGSALGEMIVRGERATLRRRFRDLVVLTASFAIFTGTSVAVCNASFLAVWLKGEIAWPWRNDALTGVLLILTCVSRCYISLSGLAKQVKSTRWVYFIEGASFVAAAILSARRWGMSGIILAAIAANLACSGAYGVRWAAGYLGVSTREVLGQWLRPAGRYLLVMLPAAGALWWGTLGLPAKLRLPLNAATMAVVGLSLLWLIGLNEELRAEIRSRLGRVHERFLRPERSLLRSRTSE